ncbi:hypothetical protein IZU99_07015 [Oscillospiraceae bacterium CM]|nr:hypothetical protein IZU99_07015 [Oscillospiraceae bacterium CM]
MSASSDKKKRSASGFEAAKRNGKDEQSHKTTKTALYSVIAFAVLFLLAIFINSDLLRQKFPAVTVDGVKYAAADFNYYFENAYMQYYSLMSNAGMTDYLPDSQTSLKSQIYNKDTGETWAAFFESTALEQMKNDTKIYKEALNAGYTLSSDEKQQIDDQLAQMKTQYALYGYTSLDQYLKVVYGKGMDEKTYRKNAERTLLISSYAEHVKTSFTYTPDELETYYQENKNDLDMFTYRVFFVEAATVDASLYSDEAAYKQAQTAALDEAGVTAKAYAAKITSEKSFIAQAKAYDPVVYEQVDSTKSETEGISLSSDYADWLKDASRRAGDVEAVATSGGYEVVLFVGRSNNHYATVTYNQIVVKPVDTSSLDTADQAAADKAASDAKQTAANTASAINDAWTAAGASGDKLTELATTYQDQIDTASSKLQENIAKNVAPDEVNAWLYNASRKSGDHTMLTTADGTVYLLYFSGNGRQYSDVLAEAARRDQDEKAWENALTTSDAKKTIFFAFAK